MKHIKRLLLMTLLLGCAFSLASCSLFETRGKSAYEIAVDNGFIGSEAEWLESLKGQSLSMRGIYEEWLSEGKISNTMTYNEFLSFYLNEATIEGKSAYEVAVDNGFTGTEAEWLASLKGVKGDKGDNYDVSTIEAYNNAKDLGYTGTYIEFLKLILNNDTEVETTVQNYNLFSVVSIISTFDVTTTSVLGNSTSKEEAGAGAGVIYKMNEDYTYIITNMHVVYEQTSTAENHIAKKIEIIPYAMGYNKNDYLEATYIGGTLTFDLAVIKVSTSDLVALSPSTHEATLGDSNTICAGDTIYAIGNPSGTGIAITKGICSVDSEMIQMNGADNQVKKYREIRIDAAINGGNSGGGIFTSDGKLVGIVNAKKQSSTIDNMAYAIPFSEANPIVDQIIKYCDNSTCERASRVLIGVQVQLYQTSTRYNSETGKAEIVDEIRVDQLVEGGYAAIGGLQVEDRLTALIINGVRYELKRQYMITDLILSLGQGDMLSVEVKRNDETLVLQIFDSTTQLKLSTLE